MPHLENASMYDNDICYNWNMIAIDNTRGNYGLISLECLCDRVFSNIMFEVSTEYPRYDRSYCDTRSTQGYKL